ncbi:MAG: restriction endonuclease subunit S [Bacteroidia bacterium]|nr:restriction endonuclease subunit S [Bacteroidia bacterium]
MEENQVHIPDGWQKKQVQEFALKMRSGGTPKSDNPRYYNGEIPFVAIDDLTSTNKFLEKTQKHITKEGLNNSAAWVVPVNTIMYSIYATLGVPRINLIEAATNQAILNIIPDESKITLEFLYYLLLEKRSSILAHSAHTTQSNLNAKIVKELEFVFPENPTEQTTIARILSKVDEAITQTEQLIAKYTRIKTGLMQDLLTKGIDEHGKIRSEKTHTFKDSPLGRIPVEWECVPLSSLSEITSGVTLGKKYEGIGTVELPYLRVANVQDGYLDLSEIKTIRIPVGQVVKYVLKEGDVLMNEGGDYDKLGRGSVWKGEIESCLHQNHVFKVRLDQDEMLPDFLALYSTSHLGKRFFLLSSKQSTNLASINKTQLKAFPILKPCPKEQHQIISTLMKPINIIAEQSRSLSKLQSLKTGLMQDLLSGRVRVTHLIQASIPT